MKPPQFVPYPLSIFNWFVFWSWCFRFRFPAENFPWQALISGLSDELNGAHDDSNEADDETEVDDIRDYDGEGRSSKELLNWFRLRVAAEKYCFCYFLCISCSSQCCWICAVCWQSWDLLSRQHELNDGYRMIQKYLWYALKLHFLVPINVDFINSLNIG